MVTTAAKQSAVRKDLLYPGRYKLPDGRTFTCEAKDIPHYLQRMKDWLKAKLPIPVRWEHEIEGQTAALSAADKAKNTFAHAADALVADGHLEVKFPADDEDDRKKLRKVKFVSPTIKWDVQDSTGKVWPGPSITEIALTPVPIQHEQQPFTLSQAEKVMAPIYLSLASYEPIRLAQDEPPPFKKEGETPEEKGPPDKEGEDAELENPEEDEDAGMGETLQTALECLAQHGIVLEQESAGEDLESFLKHIITACKTKQATENPGGPENPGGAPAGAAETPTEAQPPIMMSGATAKVFRENIRLRIENLWAKKQITKPMREKMLGELKTVKLSQTAAGEPIEDGLLAKVAAYEELPENYTAFARGVDLSRANEVDPPTPAEADRKKQEEAGSAIGALANGTAKKRSNTDRV